MRRVFVLLCVATIAIGVASAKGKKVKATMTGPYRLEVNYAEALEGMVSAGDYQWTGYGEWKENFMVVGTGMQVSEAMLVKFDRNLETSEVLAELWKRNLDPAYLEHLLAFGEAYPDEQEKYPIVALGAPGTEIIGEYQEPTETIDEHGKAHYESSPVVIDQVVGYLHVNYRGRAIDQAPFAGITYDGWSEEYRFLAIKRKKK